MKILKNIFVKSIVGLTLATALFFAPLAFARDGRGNDDRDDERQSIHRDDDRQSVRKLGSTLEIQINDNGRVLVRGAKVTGISGTTINGSTAFGSTTVVWTVKTDDSTNFVNKGGKNFGLGDISVGDIMSFSGKLDLTASSLTVNAKQVKNWSKNAINFEKHVFSGILQTAPASTTPTSFVFAVGSTNYTVNVPVGISILGKNWLALPIASYVVGDKVNVYGAIQSSTTPVIDASVVRNTSRQF
ncbi:MAG: hypothetical protein AAB587_02455 [Patescibacteria group bacterium]